MKIHDLSAQHMFPIKRYTTYECIPELVVTVPSARSSIVKKIKRFIIRLHKWSRVTFTELLSAAVKIPWHYHPFPWLSMTFAIFHDFPGLKNGLPKFHDFPWPGGTLLSKHWAIRTVRWEPNHTLQHWCICIILLTNWKHNIVQRNPYSRHTIGSCSQNVADELYHRKRWHTIKVKRHLYRLHRTELSMEKIMGKNV